MIYFQIEDNKGKVLAGNLHEYPGSIEFEIGKILAQRKGSKGIKGICDTSGDTKVTFLVKDEADLLKSSKLFKKTFQIYKNVANDVYRYYKKEIDGYAHILSTIQGQIRQKIDDFADSSEFHGESFAESVAKINNIINVDTRTAAQLICYVHKRMADMRAHLLGAEIIHSKGRYEVNLSRVSLKRAILNQCTPFLEEFDKNSVTVRFYFDDSQEIETDKNLFSLIMYNFFSNAVKYTKPASDIRMHYLDDQSCLDISMISLKMEKGEISDLFNEGIRGKYAKNIPGKGIGLFVIKRALEVLNKNRMYIDPDYQKDYQEDGLIYIENHFKFWF